jgi:O-succinylbenzoic acid--CoA ligase
MTRQLVAVDATNPAIVQQALRAALNADGPAIIPVAGSTPTDLPSEVDQRTALVIETSGSTGQPKRVELSTAALLASATAAHSELGGTGDWLLALPVTYIAGINVLVREIASQSGLYAVPLTGGFTVEGFTRAARSMQGVRRYTSLVPAQLAKLLASEEALSELRRFDRILVGGQAMPVALVARSLELGLRVTRTYGSSETAGGCVWDGVPIGDTSIEIVDGRIELAGSVLAEGYLNHPARTAGAFIERDGRRWYITDDTGEVVDGVLRVTGRTDDVIVSGGIKVSLAHIETVVRELPGLGEAVVVGAKHGVWGQSSVVVSTVGWPLDEIRTMVSARLGVAAAPSSIVIVANLPRLASGKPDRVGIAGLVESVDSLRGTP